MTAEEYDKLTNYEIRIKIAELCKHNGICPNYPEDLNACHEMEKSLKTNREVNRVCDGPLERFNSTLRGMFKTPGMRGNSTQISLMCAQAAIHATAAQRCKAFVLTMTK